MPHSNNIKLPPHDLQAEQSVLGSIMIDRNAITKVADVLSPSDFYTSAHRIIYQAMLDLFSKSDPIDVLSVTNALKTKKELETIGGASYIADLINVVPSSAHLSHYAKLIRDKRVLRDLISVSADIADSVFDDATDVEHLIDSIEQRVFSVGQKSQTRSFVCIKDELAAAQERLERLHQGGGALRGVTTGFSGLDHYLSGFQKSDMIILGARPSLGKTTLALDIARKSALSGASVGIFSLEMSKDQIIDRLIAAEAQIPLWKLRTGRLGDDMFGLVAGSLDRLSRMPVYIDDTPGLNVMQIRSISRRLQSEYGLDLVIIDYAQLIQPIYRTENFVQQFTEISHGLKALARELNVPVLVLSQLNRSVDNRETKIPKLSDLRETGSWEQDADVVMLIYRKSKESTQLEPQLEEDNSASIIIAKHRNGPIGTVDLVFDPERVTFREQTQRYEGAEE